MSYLYITEQGTVISIESNSVNVKHGNDIIKRIPIETLESISIFSKAQMTTQCTVECLKRGIPVSYYSGMGSYYGRLNSLGHVHVERQRKQAELYKSEFAFELGKRIISAKIKNQEVVLKRYNRYRYEDISKEVKMMGIMNSKIKKAISIEQMMGFEGVAARYYFEGLSKLVEEDFKFKGRSRRPPKDEFNAMLSLGYSILNNEIYGKVESKGLNPYFGFIHSDREKHPTLVSDLLEEWRAVMVDSLVMSMINGHEIEISDFERSNENKGIYLNKEGMKKFICKIEAKERSDMKYLEYIDYAVSFRRAIELQIAQLVKAIDMNDATIYCPVRIR